MFLVIKLVMGCLLFVASALGLSPLSDPKATVLTALVVIGLGLVRLLTTDEAMQNLGWNPSKPKDRRSFYRWLAERWVPVIKLGRSRRVRIREDHLKSYIENHTETPPSFSPDGRTTVARITCPYPSVQMVVGREKR